MVSYDLGVDRGCGQCPGTGFQKIGAYALIISMSFPLPIYLMSQKIEFFHFVFYFIFFIYSDFTTLA